MKRSSGSFGGPSLNGHETKVSRDINNGQNLSPADMDSGDLKRLFVVGFDPVAVSDNQLRMHFCQFGSPTEIKIVEEYSSHEDAQAQRDAFVYCEVKMSKYEETLEAVSKFDQVHHQKGLESLVVMRYKPRELRDTEDRFVPNGVELVNVPDTTEAKKGLQSFLESIPGIRCVSILLLTPERTSDPPRFNVYLETVDMADVLLLIRQLKYPAANNALVKIARVPRTPETMTHAKAMKTPFAPPKCIDPERNKQLKCSFDLSRGFQEGYEKSMANIQVVIQTYLAGAPSAVTDVKKLAAAINKMLDKPVPTSPPASLSCNSCPKPTSTPR